MRRYLRLLLIIFAFSCQIVFINRAVFAQEKIAAVVNNDIITQKDLADFINFMRMQYAAEMKGKQLEEKIESMKLDLLDRLIEDRLILQEAKRSGLAADESRIRSRINEIARRYPSDAAFQADLKKQGLVLADVQSKMRDQLLMYSIIDEKIRNKVVVRPEEVTEYYNKHNPQFKSKETRELEVFSLENEDLADAFCYGLRRKEKIEDLAVRFPFTLNRVTAQKGEDLRKDIEEMVFSLGIGEVSNPVRIDNKFYVFKLENVIAPRQLNLQEVQDKIHAFLTDVKMKQKLDEWLNELKAKSYIKISQN